GIDGGFVSSALSKLEDIFTLDQLERSVEDALRQHRPRHREWEPVARAIVVLAKANYEIQCDPEGDISERTIFPYSPTEQNGIEDARFVLFTDEQGVSRYYATYTAFDGSVVLPQMVETDDFLRFRISTLNGPEIRNKGMALFPRKIDGHYAMLSRQDGENLYLMYSDMLNFWYTKQLIVKPTQSWEFVQVGNCGSPIETDAGWLVLSHGVGPIRKYSIGAYLLDRDDPSRVIGRLSQPLLTPDVNEREGYVPNVVYSCGAVIHNGQLIIPYAMADYATTFATVPLQQVLDAMRSG
ncbi:MAG TPA: glycoside hydrolase family 130 protein, partial [Planctomycetaceae bacterium]|nr:glycoside hydrolase family 130 protein [Planctomycetaceae bacterium]